MEKVADRILNYKFSNVPSAIANCAQQQLQHAAERGDWFMSLVVAMKNGESNQKTFETDALLQEKILRDYLTYLNKELGVQYIPTCTQSDNNLNITVYKKTTQ